MDSGDTYMLAQLTGPGSINHTDQRWDVHGTDLGHMFVHRGRLYMTFGDTFGADGADWRSNVLGWTRPNERDPWNGLSLTDMTTDRPGHAKELIAQGRVPGTEVTIIPTYGVSVSNRMYLHYMAVRKWGDPGHWELNRSGIAYSDDDGATWHLADPVWPGDSNFGQVAFVERGRYLYLFGIPGGRHGGAQLARVPARQVASLKSYEYWTGSSWSRRPDEAVTIVDAPVGELSVRWNSWYGAWLMTYLDEALHAVVVRVADTLTGPWSDKRVVVTAREAPQLYAPYLPPLWNNGPDIFFALSLFGPYNVFWWHTSLIGDGQGATQRSRRADAQGKTLPYRERGPADRAAPQHNRTD